MYLMMAKITKFAQLCFVQWRNEVSNPFLLHYRLGICRQSRRHHRYLSYITAQFIHFHICQKKLTTSKIMIERNYASQKNKIIIFFGKA
jgi:hypothetical protein